MPTAPRAPNAAERASQASLSCIAALLGTERKTVWGWLRRGEQTALGAPRPSSGVPPSGQRVGRLLLADMDKLADGDRLFVARLLANAPKLADAVAMAKRLHRILRKGGDESLQDVLTAAADTLLAGFATSLSRDRDAVQAALDLPWTTSPVEGKVNRIKTIKRSMYGRAGFDLLRARVLQAA